MGNAFGNVFQRLFGKKDVRILIMGLDAAGKTTTLYNMKLGEVVTTIPTIGFNVETINIKNITVTAWDVGGRDKIRPLYRHYFHNTQGLVYVIDSNDKERLEQAIDELQRFLDEDELRGIPVLVLANKQDLTKALSPEHIASECTKLMSDRAWKVFGVSAAAKVGNSGLPEAFEWLTTAMQTTEMQKTAENWIQAWYPHTEDKQVENPQSKVADKQSYISSLVESFKKLIM